MLMQMALGCLDLPNSPKANPKQPVVDPEDSHGPSTVGNRSQHVQSQGAAHPVSKTGEHICVTHWCATALWLSLAVPTQDKSDVLSYDLGSFSKCRRCEPRIGG